MKKFMSVLFVLALVLSMSVPAFAYTWPTDSSTINWSYGVNHTGVDIAPIEDGESGDSIYAFYGGTMTKFRSDPKAGYTSHIAHVNPESTGTADKYLLSRNQHQLNPAGSGLITSGGVDEGDVIGYMGTTGSTSTGVHLHFETLVNSKQYTTSSAWYDGAFIDPVATFFPEYSYRRVMNQILPLSSETPKVGIMVENRFYDARSIATMSKSDMQIHGITQSQVQLMLPKLQGNAEYVSVYRAVSDLAR